MNGADFWESWRVRRLIGRVNIAEVIPHARSLHGWSDAADKLVSKFDAQPREGFEMPMPDWQQLHAALLTDGHPVKTNPGPFPRGHGASLPWSWWIAFEWVREVVTKARERHDKKQIPVERTNAWVTQHRPWIEAGNRFTTYVHDVVEAVQELQAEINAEVRAEAARTAEEAAFKSKAERLRKLNFRRAVADRARRDGRVQGYVELHFREFESTRPRWTYLILGENGTLYAGSTTNLRRRVRQHREGKGAAVTSDVRQWWWLLYAERHETGQGALCAEFAILHSQILQDALLAKVSPRAARLHDRHGCAVPWLGLADQERERGEAMASSSA